MWSSVVVLCVLMSSTALAGTARGTLQVGITITGQGSAPAARPNRAIAAAGKATAPHMVNAR